MSKFPFKKKTLALLTECLEKGTDKQFLSMLFNTSSSREFTTDKSNTESVFSLYDLHKTLRELELNNFRRSLDYIYPWELDGFYPNTEEAKRQREWEKIKPHINIEKEKRNWFGWTDLTSFSNVRLNNSLSDLINIDGV